VELSNTDFDKASTIDQADYLNPMNGSTEMANSSNSDFVDDGTTKRLSDNDFFLEIS
jgi:hypothetical protein